MAIRGGHFRHAARQREGLLWLPPWSDVDRSG
jgi:hypothetical protein